MFDVAPTELMVVAIVALLVIGPKDLPKAMRFVGKWVGKARAMSRHFRSGLDTMMREAEMEEMEKQWRDHNAEIMRNYPNVAQTPVTQTPASLPAPGNDAGGPTLNGEPMTHVTSEAAPVANPAPVETPPADPAAPSQGEHR